MGRESCLWRVRHVACHPEQSEGSRPRCFPFDCAQGGGCAQHDRMHQLVARAPSPHSAGMKKEAPGRASPSQSLPPDRGAAPRRYADATIRIIPGSSGAPAEPYAATGLLQSLPGGWDMGKPGFPTPLPAGRRPAPFPSGEGPARGRPSQRHPIVIAAVCGAAA